MNASNLLTARRFLPLFLSQFLETFNVNFFKNALFILVTYQITNSSQIGNPSLLINIGGSLLILPFLIFSVIAGQVADKYEKSKLIRIIKVLELGLMLLAGFGLATQSIWLTLFILFLLGLHGTFLGPVKYAILPNLLKEKELIKGNAWIEAGTFLAILFGTILGGILILKNDGIIIVSAILGISAIGGLISSFYIPRTIASAPELKIDWRIIQKTREIIIHSMENHRIFRSILGISWIWFVGVTFLALFPSFVKQSLQANHYVVTLFLTIFSVGIAAGSILCSRLMRDEIRSGYVPFACLGMSIFMIDLFFASQHWLAANPMGVPVEQITGALIDVPGFLSRFAGWRILCDLFLTAICAGIYVVPLYTLLQTLSKEAYRARIIACNNIFNALFMIIYCQTNSGCIHKRIFALVI